MPPELRRVIRLDSLPLGQTFFTEEGYLRDKPILTTTGIFEYANPDGSIRRELRLPEEVFDPESLASYRGKPVIITHDAGLVRKDNVHQHQIGTILSEGYRSEQNVRADIIIHDTDAMKKSGLKELSLGYNLDLDETPGEWNGQHYDAIQRNIRINHLALVREARAGEKARLNIDGRDQKKILKGGRRMSADQKNTRRSDGPLSEAELAKAIEEYMAKRAAKDVVVADGDDKPAEETAAVVEEATTATDSDDTVVTAPEENTDSDDTAPETDEDKVTAIKARHAEGHANEDSADVIVRQDDDIKALLEIVERLKAKKAFDEAEEKPAVEETPAEETPAEEVKKDEDDVAEAETEAENTDGDDPTPDEAANDGKDCGADKKDCGKALNADAVDDIVRQRVQLGMVGRTLNLDGLENLRITDAKKAVIGAVRPTLNLDGKSDAYIDAAYDLAVDEAKAKLNKDIEYQKKQMFNADGSATSAAPGGSVEARQRMIDRQNKI